MTTEQLVEELYLLTYNRLPDDDEKRVCVRRFDKPNATRRRVVEDLMWALMNTPEFVFKD